MPQETVPVQVTYVILGEKDIVPIAVIAATAVTVGLVTFHYTKIAVGNFQTKRYLKHMQKEAEEK